MAVVVGVYWVAIDSTRVFAEEQADSAHVRPTIVVRQAPPRRAKKPARALTTRLYVGTTRRDVPTVASGPPAPQSMASQITVPGEDLRERPVTRPGEILEATPGLIVTQHSGERKANQYFLRGYNLDHGTDMAIFVDDVPVTMRTHALGQGDADRNWLMPETVKAMDVRKGPYFADGGDFSSVGNLHIGLIDSVPKGIAEIHRRQFRLPQDLWNGFRQGRRRNAAEGRRGRYL